MKHEPGVNPLRGRRAALGLSQEDLAAHLGCSRALVSMIERGCHPADEDEKAALAVLLKCRVSDIFPKSKAA